jgi:DNA-binding HxlR family transcriptional regulator
MPRSKLPQNIDTIRYLLRSGEGARALEALGDRWSFLILRDAFLRIRRFEDLRRRTGAARGTLTTRLTALVKYGVLYRAALRQSAEPPRVSPH